MRKAYCHEGCKESYQEDRQHGLIYGQIGIERVNLPKGFTNYADLSSSPDLVLVGWEDGCKILNACRYCFTELD